MKRIIVNIFSLIFILLLAGCSDTLTPVSDSEVPDVSTQLVRLESPEEFYDISTGFILFGRSTCSTCEVFLPVINSIVSEESVVVYYFDTGFFRENSLMKENELQELFSTYQVLSVPVILRLDNGSVIETFSPTFNEKRDNVNEVQENTRTFLLNFTP